MRITIFIFLLVILAVVSLFIGVRGIAPADMLRLGDEEVMVLTISRIPRTISLILAGAGIGVSGLIMQQMTQNRFVSPTTAGSLDAAKMGLLFGFILLPQLSPMYKMLFAFAFTFAGSLLFLKITDNIRHRNVIFIPLVGIIFGSILNSISTFFAYKHHIVQNVSAWMIGDFSAVLQGRYELVYVSVPAILLTYLYADRFTVAGMGETFSRNLGLNYRTIMNLGLFCVSLTVSVVVITVGTIPFLGLIIPNIISILFGDNLRRTLPLTALFGAVFLLACDIAGRVIIYPFEIPIGVVVGIIGGVVFVILLLRRR
ncbi:ABC transporter permease [Sinomicrobium soli]|uniref:ABC transporter permease n=1 Tax=Sinomicrobium sp. N-1-3-6 TaxID=2219864 RepID=UPI000DCC551F|nr:iron chelate uptake ABC transporter family permease subunit [Sinomicrobium sp. N-1-3-6]RAV27555.1 ABC transporter permease [Sinomicrobium sp. N-1-3-6]